MTSLSVFQDRINQELGKAIPKDSQPKELYESMAYTLELGGKRMRPALLLLSCELFGGKIEQAINAALAIELFHNFTLVHDDIMDKAPLRRGKQSVHKKWNESIAILSGDALQVKAVEYLSKTDVKILPELFEIFNKTAMQVCEGQQMDMNYENVDRITAAQYIQMIGLKTAVLLAASLQMGALIGGARKEDAERLYKFGKCLGIAFQLQDDILDVYGDKQKFGKQVGGDIISNKKTYLLLKARDLANPYIEEELSNWIYAPHFDSQEKVTAVTRIYDLLGVRKLAESEVLHYHKRAMEYLHEIPVSEEKKKPLIEFAQQLVVRDN